MSDKNIQMTQRNATNDAWDNLYPKTLAGNIVASDGTADYIRVPGYAVATGSANTYAVTLVPAPTSYVDGMAVCVKINADSTGASTININGLGAKAILDSLGNAITSGGLKASTPYTLRYNGTSFIVQGKGGGGSNIKSVQRGIVTLTSTLSTVTISAVDLTKAIIKIAIGQTVADASSVTVKAVFASNTTLTFTTANYGGNALSVSWEVIEFDGIKPIQSGIYAIPKSATPTDITISTVDMTKTFAMISYSTNYSGGFYLSLKYELTSATNLRIQGIMGATTNSVSYFIIEFN